jgi:methionyl-tRNA formyltransferase
VRLNIDRVQLATSGEVAAATGIVEDSSNRLLVSTGDSVLEILEVQPAGKRAMSAAEFLRGNRVTIGDRFGPA